MFCNQCGRTLRDGVHFCPSCGAPVKAVGVDSAVAEAGPPPAVAGIKCAFCGKIVEPGLKFCNSCGKRIAMKIPSPMPTPRPAPSPSPVPENTADSLDTDVRPTPVSDVHDIPDLSDSDQPTLKGRKWYSGEGTALSGTETVYSGVRPVLSGTEPVSSGGRPVLSGTETVSSDGRPVLSGTETVYSGVGPMLSGMAPVYSGAGPVLSGTESRFSGDGAGPAGSHYPTGSSYIGLERRAIKQKARDDLGGGLFKSNWLNAVLMYILYSLISAVSSVVTWIVAGPLAYGQNKQLLKAARGSDNIEVNGLFDGFKDDFGGTFALGFFTLLFTGLWSLLLIIPGIIKNYAYSFAYYIKADHPEYGWQQCLNESKRLTKGHKGKLFLLDLSFIGWILVSVLTLGIGMFWLFPYTMMSRAEYYDQLTGESR